MTSDHDMRSLGGDPEAPLTTPEYDLDIAISFVSADKALAVAIRDGLVGSLKVFEFTNRQEELAGTDGLESLRKVFRHRARLIIILMQKAWGTTPWTRVEMEAITDRFLKEGAGFLFIITTDDGAVRQPWIPDKLLRFNVRDFPIEQAIGAIKLRASDAGASFKKETIVERVARAKSATEFELRRARLLRNEEGVCEANKSARALIAAISVRVDEAKPSLDDLGVRFGKTDTFCGFTTQTVATECEYSNRIMNTLDKAMLTIRDIRGRILLPGEGGYYFDKPKVLEESIFRPDIGRNNEWCWRDGNEKLFTTEEVADTFVGRILTLVEADAAGKLPPLWQ